MQRRFNKRLPGLRHYPYDKRLNLLKLQKLEFRRLQQDLIWCYKIVYGYVNIDYNAFLSYMSQLLGDTHINYINITTLLLMSELVLSQKGSNIWNILPTATVDFKSLSSFKKIITVVLKMCWVD